MGFQRKGHKPEHFLYYVRILEVNLSASDSSKGYVVVVYSHLRGWQVYVETVACTEYSVSPLLHINRFTSPQHTMQRWVSTQASRSFQCKKKHRGLYLDFSNGLRKKV
jgi:hypothetical protein